MNSALAAYRIVKVKTLKSVFFFLIEDLRWQAGAKVVRSTMDGVLTFFHWKEFYNMPGRFPGHLADIECLTTLADKSLITVCGQGENPVRLFVQDSSSPGTRSL